MPASARPPRRAAGPGIGQAQGAATDATDEAVADLVAAERGSNVGEEGGSVSRMQWLDSAEDVRHLIVGEPKHGGRKRQPAMQSISHHAGLWNLRPRAQLTNQALIAGLVNSAACNLTKSYMLIGFWPVSLNRSSVIRS